MNLPINILSNFWKFWPAFYQIFVMPSFISQTTRIYIIHITSIRLFEMVSSLPGALILVFWLFSECVSFWMVSIACQQIQCWEYSISYNSLFKYNGCLINKPSLMSWEFTLEHTKIYDKTIGSICNKILVAIVGVTVNIYWSINSLPRHRIMNKSK